MLLVLALSIVLGIALVPFLNVKANVITAAAAEILMIAFCLMGKISISSLINYSVTMIFVSQATYFLGITLTTMVAAGRIKRDSAEFHEYDF
jgi:hypothetical protein